jgi:tRNA dimethylallyltransferase
MPFNLITILGPTAVGKTRLSAQLANYFNGEIISADSRQVYKGMDIGTGKDLNDYIIEGNKVPYHLIDIIEPSDEFNLFLFNKLFYQAFIKISSLKKIPFFVGGTGLYLHSILKKYNLQEAEFNKTKTEKLDKLTTEELAELLKKINPALHNTTDLIIKERIITAIIITETKNDVICQTKNEINSLVIGVGLEREEIKKRITDRLTTRLENGMIEEVKQLLNDGITFERLNLFGLEYKFIGKYLSGELSYDDMFQKLNSSIHNFAKRQMTWLRKMNREGIEIHWINGPDYDAAKQIISQMYFS